MPQLPHSTERGRETLRKLRDALAELVAERGLEEVTVTAITERADVDRTTFYLYAADKYELFEAGQRQVIDEVIANVDTAGDVGDRIRAAFRHVAEHAPVYRAFLSSTDLSADQRLHEYIAGRINEALARQNAVSPVEPGILATFVASVVRGLARWWLENDTSYPADDMANIAQRLIEDGLSAFGNPPKADNPTA